MRVSTTHSMLDCARARNRHREDFFSGILRPEFHQFKPRTTAQNASRRAKRLRGFSITEMVMVVAILFILSAIAIPNATRMLQSYAAASNARSLAATLAMAKMDAARNFTQTQLNCNLAANSCQIQVCTSKGVTACNAFSAEGGPVALSHGTSFGFGSISAPAGTQTTIQNTAQIVFNSRGIPVDNTGTLTGDDGLYLTGQGGTTFAVTVNATGKIAVWQYDNGAWRSI